MSPSEALATTSMGDDDGLIPFYTKAMGMAESLSVLLCGDWPVLLQTSNSRALTSREGQFDTLLRMATGVRILALATGSGLHVSHVLVVQFPVNPSIILALYERKKTNFIMR